MAARRNRKKDWIEETLSGLESRRLAKVVGLRGAGRGLLGARIRAQVGPLLAVAASEEEADRFAEDLRFFLGDQVVRVPADDVLPYDGLAPDRGAELERLAGLTKLRGGADAVVISAKALARKVLPPSVLEENTVSTSTGASLDRDAFSRRLVELGYQNVPLVEDPGGFSVRGAIVDVWPPTEAQPTRIELFGDEVESLRTFDPETQRTTGASSTLSIAPVREVLFRPSAKRAAVAAVREAGDRVNRPTAQTRALVDSIEGEEHVLGLESLLPAFYEEGLGTLFDHLPEDAVVLLDDPVSVERTLQELTDDLEREYAAALDRGDIAFPPAAHFLPAEELEAALAAAPVVELHRLWLGGVEEAPTTSAQESTAALRQEIAQAQDGGAPLAPLLRRLDELREAGISAVVACASPGQADKICRLRDARGRGTQVHPAAAPPLAPTGETAAPETEPLEPASPGGIATLPAWDPEGTVHLLPGTISGGFIDRDLGVAIFSDEEILGPRQKRRAGRRRGDLPSIEAFRDLKEGDLCVHVDHGLCRYGGLQKMSFQGVEGDFLLLQFAGADKLYLPVWKLRQIQKFVGAGAEHARLDRLGGTSWERTKKRVRDELLEMAAELLDLYAKRKAFEGIRFPAPDRDFREFEASFPWEETPDQARAIEDVIEDMGSDAPMDRLVCGDVGFGKTEVAMRAAFLAVQGGKQVAVLVPTTLLALQHHRSFVERMRGQAVAVDWVSSLRSAKENRATLQAVADGKVDIVIGTHALLASSVSFHDLGLLVIDEEHRFGVAHKERMKRWKSHIDVLTLTATPIPRTLHMSMAGMRDMSIIRTPPPDRRSIRTFLLRFSPQEIREAILREKARGGQVFFVHDRVESIGALHRLLEELVPEVTIAVAHGQMADKALEKVIASFLSKEVDVLLSTTIVESGLDIPNANTILVNRADTFGLAQLHQLRGRVGRSSERAYAYLLLPADRTITKDAQKRLEVLQSYTELGSGFQIATHDLEIRGAGHLLGAKQSGQIEAVGFDLYVELLEEAVAQARGQPWRQVVEPEVQLPVAAFLPEAYLPDVHQRLLFYKKLSQANSQGEIDEVREELVDLCGPPPPEVDALCSLMALKAELRALGVRGLEAGPERLAVVLGRDVQLDPRRLAEVVARGQGRVRLTPDLKLVARIPPTSSPEALFGAARELVAEVAACVVEAPGPRRDQISPSSW
jgi:transcription-repair coupling factor (superfamily II helicase)